jgi:hypothetical protein
MPNRNEADLRKKLQNRNVYENRKFNKDETPSAKVARFDKWYNAAFVGEGNHSCEWIVDSGATRHMCSEKSNFRRIDETFSGNVKVANGQTIRAKGVGDVELIIFTEGEVFSVTLSNVLWVPELNENLISVNQLVRKRFVVEFRDILRNKDMFTFVLRRERRRRDLILLMISKLPLRNIKLLLRARNNMLWRCIEIQSIAIGGSLLQFFSIFSL